MRDGLPSSWINDLVQTRDDYIWIGTEGDTYVRKLGATFKRVKDAPKNVKAFCEDRNRTLWLGSYFGLFRREGTTYRRIDELRANRLLSYACS